MVKFEIYKDNKIITSVKYRELTVKSAKMLASKKLNNYYNVLDKFTYKIDNEKEIIFNRINKKALNNTITYGNWR